MDKMFKTMIVFFIVAILVSGTLFFLLYTFAEPESAGSFTTKDYLHIAQTITFSLAVITGAAASAIAFRSHRIREVDATNKRFNEAVRSMCNKDDVFIRIEGIYALERLAFNAPNNEERQRVMEVLCKQLQTVRPYDPKREDNDKFIPHEKDHEVIIDVIKRIGNKYIKLNIDLSKTNLENANFNRSNLENADFSDANLEKANFRRAKLKKANFSRADLKKADFIGANLENANFSWVNLEKANFRRAKLENADFSDANLEKADFSWAKLKKAYFYWADLSGADLSGADLSGADLSCEDLSCVDLSNTIVNSKTNLGNITKHYDIDKADHKKWRLRRKPTTSPE